MSGAGRLSGDGAWRVAGPGRGGRDNGGSSAYEEGRLPDDRPPICPACGVTMGIVVMPGGGVRHACLECGYGDDA